MGESFHRHGVMFKRPLIQNTPKQLRDLCQDKKWNWIEDPTNLDPRFARNLTRSKIIPVLEDCFSYFSTAAARSMRHMAQAQELLVDLAQIDLLENPKMELSSLRRLSEARLSNLLRYWLQQQKAYPSEAQLFEAISQITATSNATRSIDIKCGNGRLVKKGLYLTYHSPSLVRPSLTSKLGI